MKAFLVDSIAAVFFFGLLAVFGEVFVARMSLEQVIAARLAAIPLTLATGRPYGLWRDLIFRRACADKPPRWRRILLDAAAFLSFQVPVYIAILAFAGAGFEQMARAIPMAILLMLATSRLYGLYLEQCRHLAGLQPLAQ